MSSQASNSTHEQLKAHIGPIHDEIGKLNHELERIRSEQAILKAMAVHHLDTLGISREAIGSLAAACW